MSAAGSKGTFEADYIIVPGNVLRDALIGPSAKLAYGRLKFYAGNDGLCFMKHETLAAEICVADRQVRYILMELRAAGWMDWKRGRITCTYTVHAERKKTEDQARDDLGRLRAERHKVPIKIGTILRYRTAQKCR